MTPTQEAELDTVEQADEETRVLEWRFHRLSRLGLDDAEATDVAGSNVDVHEVERLLAMSCPLELAIRILR